MNKNKSINERNVNNNAALGTARLVPYVGTVTSSADFVASDSG